VKLWLILAALAALVLYFPAALAALIGALGTLAVTAAAQPACWAFGCGLLAANRHNTHPATRATAPKAGQA
jgi:hypothetical protein